ncbi:MAG TPA: hypothetical protein PKD24_14760 [Pyrinomonadaceae bacterium]|nr:hypothetical protein [Pyrinomonadaceae bacterium]HMP66635.1 hypothetical protein [Pyrinomonadaceae bacterium]
MDLIENMQNRRPFLILLAVAALLTVPLVAMQFTAEVNWTAIDFIVAGVLLLGTGMAIEAALRIVQGFWARIAVCGVILLILFLIWAELAVGIFGTRFAGS